MIGDRPQIPEPSAFFEPWMYPDQDAGEGVKDFQLREHLGCGNSIASRSAVSDLYMIMRSNLPDF